MNKPQLPAVGADVRTLVAAATLALGLSFASPPLPILDPELTLSAAGNRDGGKKRKDEEKEEDYALGELKLPPLLTS